MQQFLVFVLIVLAIKISPIPKLVLEVGHKAQSICQAQIPSTPYHPLNQSLVCGSPLNVAEWSNLFRTTGLIHVLVVSGAHLVWLDQALATVRLSARVRLVVLALYSLFTGFGSPVVRSLFQILCQACRRRVRWRLNRSHIVGMSGLMAWSLIPQGESQLSLQLSWACVLLLLLAQLLRRKIEFVACLVVYGGLSPLLQTISLVHPLTILSNYFLAGFLGTLMFPVSLLSCVIPPLAVVMDQLWHGLLALLSCISPYLESQMSGRYTPRPLLWLYVFVLQAIVMAVEVRARRRLWQKP